MDLDETELAVKEICHNAAAKLKRKMTAYPMNSARAKSLSAQARNLEIYGNQFNRIMENKDLAERVAV